MKKTTKILLVLAAVVAMTIGAVSTVMAADDDYAKITAWGGDASKGYIAFDENGEQIARGWAMADSGRWYFFDSGKCYLTHLLLTIRKSTTLTVQVQWHLTHG